MSTILSKLSDIVSYIVLNISITVDGVLVRLDINELNDDIAKLVKVPILLLIVVKVVVTVDNTLFKSPLL